MIYQLNSSIADYGILITPSIKQMKKNMNLFDNNIQVGDMLVKIDSGECIWELDQKMRSSDMGLIRINLD